MNEYVAPHAGAWIEMRRRRGERCRWQVAPHAGAWIEIGIWLRTSHIAASRPTRARGLKLRRLIRKRFPLCRAPRGRVNQLSATKNSPAVER